MKSLMKRFFISVTFFASIAAPLFAAEPPLVIVSESSSGLFSPGEKARWTVKAMKDGSPMEGKLAYTVLKNGISNIGTGSVDLVGGKGVIDVTSGEAGWLMVSANVPGPDGKAFTALGGAVFSPDKVKPEVPVPADFDEFWKKKISELEAIPMNAKVELVETDTNGIEYYKVSMDNIWGTRIQGQLAKPAGKTDLPVMIQFQYAGVYPLSKSWVIGPAKSGWLTFNILAHDLPIDQPADFYKKIAEGELKDYVRIGWEDREKSYFLRMLLGCYRAVEFMKQRPDWNKKTLLVKGTSQGGLQALSAAALHPSVTSMIVEVPAGCDFASTKVGRRVGWPYWGHAPLEIREKVLEAGAYFDGMHFASRIKVPSVIAVGLVDTTSTPTAVISTFNALLGPRELVPMPNGTHTGNHQPYFPAYSRFVEAQMNRP